MKEYRPAKKRISVSVGESVRVVRQLQELSQNRLAQLTGIPQATISAIENDRVRLGVERAKVLAKAKALKRHPGVLVFPGWQLPRRSRDDSAFPMAKFIEQRLTGTNPTELAPGIDTQTSSA